MASDPVTSPRPPRTLVEELAGEVASIWGEVYGDIGPFSYRVFMVVVRWTGGAKGRGKALETSRKELQCGLKADGSPSPPQVTLGGAFSRTMHGTIDVGEATVEKLDPTYTEADLCDYGRLEEADESFYEIRQDGRDGGAPDRPTGRYVLLTKPIRGDYARGWQLRLQAQEPGATFGDREEAG